MQVTDITYLTDDGHKRRIGPFLTQEQAQVEMAHLGIVGWVDSRNLPDLPLWQVEGFTDNSTLKYIATAQYPGEAEKLVFPVSWETEKQAQWFCDRFNRRAGSGNGLAPELASAREVGYV